MKSYQKLIRDVADFPIPGVLFRDVTPMLQDATAFKQVTEDFGKLINLNEVDVSNVEAIASTVKGGTPFREDIAVSSKEISDAILKNAPKSEDNYFVVPKIIE